MKIDLNTLYSAITAIVISSVFNAAVTECAIYSGAWGIQQRSIQPDYGYMKGYAMPVVNSLQHPYHFQAGSYPYPHPHSHPYLHQPLHPYHHPQQHHYHQVPPQAYHDPHMHQHNEDHYLREYAKDPRNLKNGIVQNGAITYDLGMPHYNILNAHEMPEIITSDQPHYQEHLKELQQSQNFTLEDFGATTAPPATEATTTTEKPMEETSTPPSKPYVGVVSSGESTFIRKSVNQEVSHAKDQIQQVQKDMKSKVNETPKTHQSSPPDNEENNSNIYIIRKHEGLSKKMKPSSFKKHNKEHSDKGNGNATKDSDSQSEMTNTSDISEPESNRNSESTDSARQEEESKANENQPIEEHNFEAPHDHGMYLEGPNDQMQPPSMPFISADSAYDDRSMYRHMMPQAHYPGYALPYQALPPTQQYSNVPSDHMPMGPSMAPSNTQRAYRSPSKLNKREKAKESG